MQAIALWLIVIAIAGMLYTTIDLGEINRGNHDSEDVH